MMLMVVLMFRRMCARMWLLRRGLGMRRLRLRNSMGLFGQRALLLRRFYPALFNLRLPAHFGFAPHLGPAAHVGLVAYFRLAASVAIAARVGLGTHIGFPSHGGRMLDCWFVAASDR
jgi:hypothetical protein